MAKWRNIHSKSGGTLKGSIEYDGAVGDSYWRLEQDETPFLEQAKRDREATQKKDVGYKKACTIPDIVAIEILEKYGIDIHADSFMHDSDSVRRVLQIMRTDYPHLMSY